MESPPFGAADLSNCDREPIQIPGSIQPHGVLLALDPKTLCIQQVGGNTRGLLGAAPEDLLGRPVEAWIGPGQVARLHDILQVQRQLTRPLPAFETVLEGDERRVDAIVHETDGVVVLEFEPPDLSEHDDTLALMQTMLQQVQGASTVAAFCQAIAEAVRTITGFDRVMVYRFLPDGSGAVDAEAHATGMDAFLGLHFPTSDIPRQARELYQRNWLRLIPDARYTPAPLWPELSPVSGQPLDLSHSVLRSVSPLHLEYLANMGVAASMSVSIVLHGKLWGLIACHHRTPRFVPHRLRVACELFAEMASFQLETRVAAHEFEGRLATKRILEELILRLSHERDVAAGLTHYQPALLNYIAADGIALCFDGQVSALGRTPRTDQVTAIVTWLNSREERILATDRLAALFAPAAAYPEVASGLLALSLSTVPPSYLLWFRSEVIQTVVWAGDYHKPMEVGPNGDRLTPRKSFAAWKEEVHQQSLPWRDAEIEAATSLRLSLLEVVLRQIDTVSREREEARRRQDVLMAELDHRVKNMLATIQALVNQSRTSADSLDDFLATFDGRLRAMSQTHSLLTKSRWEGANLRLLIGEEMAPYMSGAVPAVKIVPESPIMLRPKAALALSLAVHELATNAAKYGALSAPGGRVHIDWHVEQHGGPVLVLRWRETGGPAVTPPARRGFGLTLIENNLSYELGATVQLGFPAGGLTCDVTVPWDQIATPADPPPPPAPARAGAVPTPAALAGARILVVEDNGLLASIIVTNLKAAGMAVIGPAPRLAVAVELAETAGIDLAMLDIDLDGTMVWPAADVLASRGIPFLFCTGYQASLVMPPRFQARPVLNKPFMFRDVLTALVRLVEESSR